MPSNFSITIVPDWYEGVAVFRPLGRFESAEDIHYYKTTLGYTKDRDVILDMSSVHRLSPQAADAIIDGHLEFMLRDKMLRLCCIPEQPWKLIGSNNYLGTIVPYATVEEAAASMSGPTRQTPPRLIAAPSP